MTKKNELPLPEMVVESKQDLMSGIFVSEHKMNNMDMHRIVVCDAAIQTILSVTRLSVEAQEDAVNKLVDRTPEWLDLEEVDRYNRIKSVLTQETVLEYLIYQEAVTNKVDTVELGVDEEGSIVICAYYTNMNREQRRAKKKQYSQTELEAMERAVNLFESNDNLVDLAKKKLEKLQKEGKLPKGKGAK